MHLEGGGERISQAIRRRLLWGRVSFGGGRQMPNGARGEEQLVVRKEEKGGGNEYGPYPRGGTGRVGLAWQKSSDEKEKWK